VLHVPGTCTI